MTDAGTPRPRAGTVDRVFNLAWLLVAIATVLLALYVVLAGQVLSLMGERRADIAEWLGERLGMRVEIDQIAGNMNLLTPEVRLRGVRVYVADGTGEPAFTAPEAEAHVDVMASLLARRPVLDLLRVRGVQLTLVEGEDGQFRVKGFPFDVNDPRAAERMRQALTVFYRQHVVLIDDSRLLLESQRVPVTSLDGVMLRIINDGDVHRVAGEMTVAGAGRVPLSFVVRFSGQPLAPADLFADVYVRARPSSLEGWLPRRDAGPLWLDSLSGGGEAWLRVEGQKVTRIRGSARIDSLALSRDDGTKVEGLLGLAARFSWEPAATAGSWRLAVGGFGFRRQGYTWPESDAALEWQVDAEGRRQVHAMFTRGSVELLAGLTELLPPEQATWREALVRMAPRGEIGPLHFTWDEAAAPDARWRLASGFAQLGLRPDGGIPGGNGLSGSIEVLPTMGRAHLQARQGQLDMPTLFADVLPLDSADIDIVWDKTAEGGWRLRSGLGTVATPDARANALFTVLLPPPAVEGAPARALPRLQLLGLIEDGDPRATPRYLPKVVSADLNRWLGTALAGGRLTRGSFLVDGPLGGDAGTGGPRTFQMRYEGRDITLAFLPGWPSLTGADADVLIEGGRVDARASQGMLRDSRLTGIRVAVLPRANAPSELTVNTHLDGDVADAFVLFRDTPLRDAVPAELLRWDGGGRLVADVAVSHLLGGGATRVTVGGSVDGAVLQSAAHALEVTDVSGRLRYDTQAGFSAEGIRGRALGSDLSGDARTTRTDSGLQTRLDLRGRLRMADVGAWLKIPALDLLRGNAEAAVQLRFGGNSGDVGELEVRSDLRGIVSSAPAPLAKPAESAVDTRLIVTLGTDEPRLRLVSGRALAADLQLKGGTPVSGMVALGNARLAPVSGPGLVIEGDVENLVLGDWADFTSRLGTGAPAAADNRPSLTRALAGLVDAGDRLRKVNIVADRLDTGALVLDAATLRMGREENGWQVRVDSRALRGQLLLPDGYQERGDKPLVVQVDSLNLPAGAPGNAGIAAVLPVEVPRLALALNNLKIGNEDYGSWSLETVPVKDGVELRDVHGAWRALDITGQGDWLAVAGGGTRSRFQGDIKADDISRVSVAFGYQPQLSSSATRSTVDLVWPGNPTDIDLLKTQGRLTLSARDGRFVSGSAKTQALRAFGVFNINTWQRRMKFDFSDLYRKGVAFDTLTGDITLDAGNLSSENLVAKGPSAIFEMSGRTGLEGSTLQSRLRVTLPVNSNLYVGCLAGLAACAGIVAAEQLWGDRLEKMTTLVYDVSGTWEDPVVKLVQGVQTPGG